MGLLHERREEKRERLCVCERERGKSHFGFSVLHSPFSQVGHGGFFSCTAQKLSVNTCSYTELGILQNAMEKSFHANVYCLKCTYSLFRILTRTFCTVYVQTRGLLLRERGLWRLFYDLVRVFLYSAVVGIASHGCTIHSVASAKSSRR